jgi:GxxExxY protein
VHSIVGPGLLESVYETAMSIEMTRAGLSFRRQAAMPLYYKGELISEHRVDLLVEDAVIVEIKSIERVAPIHIAQMLTYLKVADLKTGLIMNFNSQLLRAGLRRVLR